MEVTGFGVVFGAISLYNNSIGVTVASLRKYFRLMKEYPQLFANPNEAGVVRIIKDPEKIKVLQAEKKQEYRVAGKKPEWIDIGVLSEDPWFWVLRDLVEFPDGRIGGYLRVLNRKSLEGGVNVVMFPVLEGKVVLLKRFSHDNRDWIWEIPHGFGEPELSADECARTELEQETGLITKNLTQIGYMENLDGATAFYYAEMVMGELKPDMGEAIAKCELISLSEFEKWLFTGMITDWFATISYLMCKRKSIF